MRQLARLLALLLVAVASLQIFFVARVALMRWIDPQSTTFQRSEWWRLRHERGAHFAWSQQWVDGGQIAESLKRAVIASEDAGFVEHSGVEWDAIERAWERNQRVQSITERRAAAPGARQRPVKLVGGSTITQQLAKNLFLTGERTLARKAQEFVLTWTLEALLDKRRILEIYLNSVEWGEGVFGAQAAALPLPPRRRVAPEQRWPPPIWPCCCRRPSASSATPARPTSAVVRPPSRRAWAMSNCPETTVPKTWPVTCFLECGHERGLGNHCAGGGEAGGR